MCVGIPMQVIEVDGSRALCRARDGEHAIDMSLVGTVEAGTWVMTFLGAARETISEETARQSADALAALEMVMRGDVGFEHLFADLIDREPELPEFLRPKTQRNA
ncbi:HypC/HybG/HupF family hydrogenase formation chaperone [Oricola thermophila]|uniref:HypC/HybG/HupF family hydrogenase formation chaperone n=2 Tax=Oricola thermophila TaxID=2742145 RepID=A0A6N1V9W6_9HYPH|nr:HypC/HybG/HupF family hydrogenase formation chaperone [Oricola thermophila]